MPRIYFERRELPGDLERLFDTFWSDPAADASTASECSPPLDVLETETGVEVVMDLPGVPAEGLQIVSVQGVLLIAGRKAAPSCEHRGAAFHLAERAFGRFARAVRLEGAFDTGRASASLTAGELRIVVPRIEERRGRQIAIPVRG